MKLEKDTNSYLSPLDRVAKAWGISIYGVRRLVASKAVRSVNVGARVMVPSEEVERVIREGVGTPRPRHAR
jgi:hypothetical protein